MHRACQLASAYETECECRFGMKLTKIAEDVVNRDAELADE
jgi:hypothetical protein